jgi:cobalt-zinc-cadmium efflux system protein
VTHGAGASVGRLRIALVATACVAAFEIAGGFAAGSLALLSDAAHVAMDVVALGIALAASVQARRPATERQTYGFARIEILAALANGALLTAVTVLVIVEAIRRFSHPELPHGALMAAVAAVALVVNVVVGMILLGGEHRHAGHDHVHRNLNMRAALLHVGGDALGAAAVIAGGAAIALTRAAWIDPLLSLLVCAIIVYGIVALVREAADVLLESAPGHAAIPEVIASMESVDGVVEVHHVHVWTLGPGSYALSAHVVLDDRKLSEASVILRAVERTMQDDFAIGHVTVQLESETCDPDTAIVCHSTATAPLSS